jgi:hypothetical protein
MDSARILRLLALGLMIAAMLVPAGCSDDDDDDNPTGGQPPAVDEDLVTVWRATSVTVDGTPMALGEFFEFSAGAVALNLTITSDGTYTVEELDSATDPANVLYTESGLVESDGQTLTLTMVSEDGVDLPTPEVVAEGTWLVAGFVLTFTMQEEGSTVVITFSNWLA